MRLKKLPNVGLQNKFPYESIRIITAEENEMGRACSGYDQTINLYRFLVGKSLPFL
jgi:hypothetical protein